MINTWKSTSRLLAGSRIGGDDDHRHLWQQGEQKVAVSAADITTTAPSITEALPEPAVQYGSFSLILVYIGGRRGALSKAGMDILVNVYSGTTKRS